MERRWPLRDDIFQQRNGLWWLNEKKDEQLKEDKTPMTVALRNGNISGVIDVKVGGLSWRSDKRGYF
jgi:hypothetical protein